MSIRTPFFARWAAPVWLGRPEGGQGPVGERLSPRLYAPDTPAQTERGPTAPVRCPGLLYEPYNARMALTVEDLLKTAGLDIRLVAGSAGLGGAIRWVHVSELEDPTPWLKGGEILLTTGMGVGKTPGQQRAYLDRLRRAGLVGLGFGTGFSFKAVPRPLAQAADRAAFPV